VAKAEITPLPPYQLKFSSRVRFAGKFVEKFKGLSHRHVKSQAKALIDRTLAAVSNHVPVILY
jgi:hypothetical protein